MKGYAGSIAWSADGQIALTSPRGGVVMIHDSEGRPLATHVRADVCGIAAAAGSFLASDGNGALWSCTEDGMTPLGQGGPQWDNHIVSLG